MREIIIICEDGSDFYFHFQGFFAPPELIDEKVFPYNIFFITKKGWKMESFSYTHILPTVMSFLRLLSLENASPNGSEKEVERKS